MEQLFANNRAWADRMREIEPGFFERLSAQQAPEFLWIGCSDSRVPANEIVGLSPGELFVHRNVANVVVHTDLNCLAVLQFAVEVLRVKHVMVTGHYGCGGVRAALDNPRLGLIDNWLRHVQDVRHHHAALLARTEDRQAQLDSLCRLNVIEQVVRVAETTIVRDAWARQQPVTIHGWIYSLRDGLIRNLGMKVASPEDVVARYDGAVAAAAPVLGGIEAGSGAAIGAIAG